MLVLHDGGAVGEADDVVAGADQAVVMGGAEGVLDKAGAHIFPHRGATVGALSELTTEGTATDSCAIPIANARRNCGSGGRRRGVSGRAHCLCAGIEED